MNHVLSHRPRRRLPPLNTHSTESAQPEPDMLPADVEALFESLGMTDLLETPPVETAPPTDTPPSELPVWNADMDRMELLAVAQAAGLSVTKMDNKATIVKALKSLVPVA